MPIRKIPFVNEEYYHVFNRGVEKRHIFTKRRDYQHFVGTLEYYRFSTPIKRFSHFLKLSQKERCAFFTHQNKIAKRLVDIHCFVLMPNHFHFILQQKQDNGISKFIKLISDSYTRFFNIKYKRNGPLLQGQFKAVRIEDENQLLHLFRYIVLNPYTSYIVKNTDDLITYSWSTLPEYLGLTKGFCKLDIITDPFSSKNTLKKFIFDQADYQRKLEMIKHLTYE